MTDFRVLVVDDAPEIRRLVGAVIRMSANGWRVVADACDGAEGVEQARTVQPDLVLLDLSMPVMDGLEALPLIRAAAPAAAVVILTGLASNTARDTALAAGADGYIEKDNLLGSLVPQLTTIVAGRPPCAVNGHAGS